MPYCFHVEIIKSEIYRSQFHYVDIETKSKFIILVPG